MAAVQASRPPPPPQWVLDLNSTSPTKSKAANIPDPPGYQAVSTSSGKRNNTTKQSSQTSARKTPTTEEMDTLKLKKAWELAIAPAKQLPMNGIMMYMSGNSLQIFSIMMVWMLFKNPINAILNINPTFARFETEGTKTNMLLVKIAYIATNLLALALGIWKVNGMGLLPTTRSDWLAWEAQREPLERARMDISL
ncbi:hypothetical protein EV356DRAFT_512292 [Viridothelium virens]|uniref:ER membrane protein complex subunit 4 n=1 Tax=Viridothelium virens TaxID=1048519 RepID=A0A6A6HGQ0_VIRVR|nr:hypothetical protein EV356DRAFT_512292 [Viridothelium virens]